MSGIDDDVQRATKIIANYIMCEYGGGDVGPCDMGPGCECRRTALAVMRCPDCGPILETAKAHTTNVVPFRVVSDRTER